MGGVEVGAGCSACPPRHEHHEQHSPAVVVMVCVCVYV